MNLLLLVGIGLLLASLRDQAPATTWRERLRRIGRVCGPGGGALVGVDLEIARDEIRQATWRIDAAQHLIDDLLGESGAPAKLAGPLPQLTNQCDEGRVVRVGRRHLVGRLTRCLT